MHRAPQDEPSRQPRFAPGVRRRGVGALPFRIAHLSDLHLTARGDGARHEPGWGRLRGMNEALRWVLRSEPVQRADLLLVTGDVTDTGAESAWKLFAAMLRGAGLEHRTLAIPGNHDMVSLSLRIGNPASLARRDRARTRAGLEAAGQPSRFPWARQVDPRVVIFGLDTNNAGNLTPLTNAKARVGADQLAALASLLERHHEVPVKIVALHHSPNIPARATQLRREEAPTDLLNRWAHQFPK
ncbi:MAG: metallophosphoesterase, partial [Myxococcales bacterium]|nr:metallophosphoesterase [Myxococcales bacterium]